MPLASALADIVGRSHALTDPDLRAPYETDWTGRFGGTAAVVVRPGSAAEVAAVVRAVGEAGAVIVPQGGNTGLVGGGIPRGERTEGGDSPGECAHLGREQVVLSLARLNHVGEPDALGLVTAGAGATLAALQARGDAGLDFGARDSATLGGIVACDAGGARALRHGTARARVAGLEAVLADGSRIERLAGLLKDNAGYDLPALLVGSEGTLAIVTAVRWRTVPRLPHRVTAFVPLKTEDAPALVAALREGAPSLEACDFMTDACLQLALTHQRRDPPTASAPLYAIVECAARHDPTEELAAIVPDAAVADDTAGRAALWRLREGMADAIAARGVPHKLDVGVPLDALPRFLGAVGGEAYLFGHLADGNVHVNLLGDADEDAVLELVLELGGTISAEHGVGVAKARWLERARGAAEVHAMRAIKHALDPDGILNPGVIIA
jgi:FAD/FMN-containing dehydrogenase